jgi:hypothetical protein
MPRPSQVLSHPRPSTARGHGSLRWAFSFSENGSPCIFFCTRAFGLVLEEGGPAIYRSMLGVTGMSQYSRRSEMGESVPIYLGGGIHGVCSTPVYVYPAIRMKRGEAKDRILPFSVLRFLLGWE